MKNSQTTTGTSALSSLDELRKYRSGTNWPRLAFIGRAGSGKTTAAEFLVKNMNYVHLSFARKLKDIAAQLWGPTAQKDRAKLQALGTALRDLDEEVWLYPVARDIESVVDDGGIVVDDCRFENEFDLLVDRGFYVVRVEAAEDERVRRLQANGKFSTREDLHHVSEERQEHFPTHYRIENGNSIEAFEDEVVKILWHIQARV